MSVAAVRPIGWRRAGVPLAVLVLAAGLAGCGHGHPTGASTGPSTVSTVSAVPTPTATGPGGGPVGGRPQSDFAPAAASYVSPAVGFALGTVPCVTGGTTLCPALLRTVDGGSRWSTVPPPPLLVLTGSTRPQLVFADALDGYAADGRAGDPVAVTHDGGRSWAYAVLPDAPADAAVTALAVDDRRVFVVAGDASAQRLWAGRANGGALTTSGPVLPGTAGAVSLAVSEGSGWLTVGRPGERPLYLRSDDTRSWSEAEPPCTAGQDASVAATDALRTAMLCQAPPPVVQPSAGRSPAPVARTAWRSTDGGRTFVADDGEGGEGELAGFAAPTASSVVLATTGRAGDRLLRSTGSGPVLTYASSAGGVGQGLQGLGFVDAGHGWVVLGTTGGYARGLAAGGTDVPTTRLLVTADGGQHWAQAIFRP